MRLLETTYFLLIYSQYENEILVMRPLRGSCYIKFSLRLLPVTEVIGTFRIYRKLFS